MKNICTYLILFNLVGSISYKKASLNKTKISFFSTTPIETPLVDFSNMLQLEKAWDISRGSWILNVGVMDSGVSQHTDLVNNLHDTLSFSGESSKTAYDDNVGHGTGVAGIIGAVGNNNINSACGICWDINIVPLRVSNENISNLEDETMVINALNYASAHNIKIINFSGGFPSYSTALYQAISNYDGLLICSSGNAGNSYIYNGELGQYTSNSYVYPASFDLDNVISVNGVEDDGSVYANGIYLNTHPDLLAPAFCDNTTGLNNSYQNFGATSCAAATVTGVAALVKSTNLLLTPAEIKSIILNSVDVDSSYATYCSTSGRLNAYKAVKAAIPYYTETSSLFGMSFTEELFPTYYRWCRYSGSGVINLKSFGNAYLACDIYNSNDLETSIYSSSNTSSNFDFNYDLGSNGSIYIRVKNVGTVADYVSLKISQVHSHTYTDSYVWHSNTKHKSYCSCGEYKLEGHVVSSGGFNPLVIRPGLMTCLRCGGEASIGFVEGVGDNVQIIGDDSYLLCDGTIILGENDQESLGL